MPRVFSYRADGARPCPYCGAESLQKVEPIRNRQGRVVALCIMCGSCLAKGPVVPIAVTGAGREQRQESVDFAVWKWNGKWKYIPPSPAPSCEGDEREPLTAWQDIFFHVQTGRPAPVLNRPAAAALEKMGGYDAACAWKPEDRPAKRHEFFAHYLTMAKKLQNAPESPQAGQDESS